MVDRTGLPLSCVLSGANRNDAKMLEAVVKAVPPFDRGSVLPPRGVKLHADKGYDFDFCRSLLRQQGLVPRIARRGVESSERLGKHRWVVERTHSWLSQFRRLRVRYERRDDIHLGFSVLGCSLICFRELQKVL